MTQKNSNTLHSKIEQITAALDGLEYGSVHIIVHDAKIVEIDRLEKRRFSVEKQKEDNKRLRSQDEGRTR